MLISFVFVSFVFAFVLCLARALLCFFSGRKNCIDAEKNLCNSFLSLCLSAPLSSPFRKAGTVSRQQKHAAIRKTWKNTFGGMQKTVPGR